MIYSVFKNRAYEEKTEAEKFTFVTFCKRQGRCQLCIEQCVETQAEQDQSVEEEDYTNHHCC